MSDRHAVRTAVRRVLQHPSQPYTAVATCLVACLSTAAAQIPATEQTLPTVRAQSDSTVSPPVTTQLGKTPQLLRDIPQTVSVIDRATIDAQGATTMTEVLRNVPGITLSAGEGGFIGDNVNLRGFSARTDLFVDGMRDRGQYARETAFLESVEVLKGPSSMLFGRGSTGGIINQVTKQPHRRSAATTTGSVGSDPYLRFTADLNQPLTNTTAWRLSAFGHRADATRDIVTTKRYGVAPSLRLGIGTANDVLLSAIYQYHDDVPDYGIALSTPTGQTATRDNPARPIERNPRNFYGFTDDRFEQQVMTVAARLTREFSPHITLRNQLQYNQASIDARPTRLNVSAANYAIDRGIRQRVRRDVKDTSLFNQTDLILQLGSGFLRHTLTTGFEVGRDTYDNQSYTTTGPDNDFDLNLSNPRPDYGPLPATASVTRNTFTDNAADTLAVYLNEQLDIGERFKVVAGLRWDSFDFETKVTNAAGVRTTDLSKKDTMTSYRSGVVFQPDHVQTYYLSFGTSFNPSAETLVLTTANQAVGPEKNRSYELGAKWNLVDDDLLVTAALFRVDKTDARSTDFGVVTLEGSLRVEGWEAGVSGAITERWRALAGYTYLEGEVLYISGVSGTVAPNTPKHSASLWTTYELPHGLQLGAGLVHSAKRWLNNQNTAVVDGYTRCDATVAYVAQRYSLRVNVRNLTDTTYYEVASAARATPVTGRSILATVTWNF